MISLKYWSHRYYAANRSKQVQVQESHLDKKSRTQETPSPQNRIELERIKTSLLEFNSNELFEIKFVVCLNFLRIKIMKC